MVNRWGKKWKQGSKITEDGDYSHEIKRYLLLGRKAMTNLDSRLKSRLIILPTKVCRVKTTVFPVVMYRCESWTIKNTEHRSTDAFELWCWRRCGSFLGCKEIKPVNPNGNQPWIFNWWRTDTKAEAPIIWPPDVKNQLTGKDPEAGKDWDQEKGVTENEMVGWYHQLNGDESEQTSGDSEGQGRQACCSPWGCKELDMTEWLNRNNKNSESNFT